MYQFIVVDTRKPVVPANTLGIEITIPEIAAMCDLGNIDPQHGCGKGAGLAFHLATSAIDHALRLASDPTGKDQWELLPAVGATLATVRPDLDALGAMALLALARSAGTSFTLSPAAIARIRTIDAADGNTSTTWAPRSLPTTENPWPAGVEIGSRRELAAIAAVVSDHKLSVPFRVACVATWILGGECPTWEQSEIAIGATLHQHLQPGFWPAGPGESEDMGLIIKAMSDARARVEAERADMIAALSDGRITITLASCPRCDGVAREHERGDAECVSCGWDFPRTAIVRSTHRAATSLGQSIAPLAICFHPAFRWPQGHTTPKATIAWAVPPGAEVVARVRDALNAAEREKTATQIDSIDLGVTYEGDFPGVFFDSRPGSAVGAATLLRGGHVAEALDVIANMRPADTERFAKDIAIIVAAIKSEWGGNLASGILGSPQGRASALTEEQIVEIVRGAL